MKKITLLFLTLSISLIGYAQFPEDFESGVFPPAGWTSFIGTNGLGTAQNWAAHDGSYPNTGARCRYENVSGGIAEDWLVTPSVTIDNTNKMLSYLMVQRYTSNYGSECTIRVSTASQTTHADFTIVDTFDESDIPISGTTMNGSLRGLDLSAYIGQSIYVAFVFAQDDGDNFRLDNVDFTECFTPITVAVSDYSQTTIDIAMSAVGNYQVEWGPFPYTEGSGGSTATVTGGDTYQLTGLTPGVSYNVFVKEDCGGGNYSSNSVTPLVDTTLIGTSPTLALPYGEDFELDANQSEDLLEVNLGISRLATASSWLYSPIGYLTGHANDGDGYIQCANNTPDTDVNAWFYIGPFNLTTDNEYTFSFMQRVSSPSSPVLPAEDFEVVVATTTDGTTDNVLLTLNDIENITYESRSVTYTPTVSGDYYFGVHDISDFLATITVANLLIVDTITLTSQPLSVDEFDTNSFTHVYDKDLKVLNLESSASMTGLEIYSILGQNVISKTLSSTNASVNLSELTDGIYIAKVNINDSKKTFKFVKN